MSTQPVKPTREIYLQLERATDYFNRRLFDGRLPACVISLQREKNTMGYFLPLRWAHTSGKNVHEISLNPVRFAECTLIEFFQKIVHEQCHLWQHEFGSSSRPGYHNTEWANQMELIGLIPSDSGKPGGKRTGQRMDDYPIDGGRFKSACTDLVESGFVFSWIDRGFQPSIAKARRASKKMQLAGSALGAPVTNYFRTLTSIIAPESTDAKHKVKYSCPECGVNVWGKPTLSIRCEGCGELFASTTISK